MLRVELRNVTTSEWRRKRGDERLRNFFDLLEVEVLSFSSLSRCAVCSMIEGEFTLMELIRW